MKKILAAFPAVAPLAIMLLITGCASTPPAAPTDQGSITVPLPSAPVPTAPPAQADNARRAEFDASLNRWHGAPLSELQAKMGKPSTVTRGGDGRTTYAYTRAMAADPGTGTSRFSCTVRFIVDDKSKQVQSHQIEGC